MKQVNRRQLIYPGPTGWVALARDPAAGKSSDALEALEIESPKAAPTGAPTDLLLPTVALVAVPLWLQGDDSTLFDGMIPLQLEKRGVRPGSDPVPVRWRKVAEADGRTLILATTLAQPVDPALELPEAESFEPYISNIPLPPDHLVLHAELGHVVASCTRGQQLAWFQVLGGDSANADTLLELRCMLLQLAAEGVLGPLKGVLSYIPLSPEAEATLNSIVGIRPTHAELPRPKPPTKDLDLLPPPVAAARIRASRRGQIRKALAIAALLYLLLVAGAAGYLGVRYARIASLQREVASTSTQVSEAKDTAARWRALEPAIQPALYPLEQLYRAAKYLPPEGVRFTLLEQRGDSILIRGEAKNAPAAFKLFEDIKGSADWVGYTWQMPKPKLLPNGSAQFQMEGSRGHATAQR